MMDLEQVLGRAATSPRRRGAEDDSSEADVLVVCAATALTAEHLARRLPGRERARSSTAIAARLDGFARRRDHGHEPGRSADRAARPQRSVDRRRVLGYTFNDRLRLRRSPRSGPARAIEDVWVLGEHGDGAVPIFSRVR